MMKRLIMMALLAMLLPVTNALSAPQNDEKEITKLAVRGTAELKKPADELRLTVGVITVHRDATEAMQENAKRMTAVIRAIKKAGLDDDEFETGRFRVMPRYSRRPRQPDPDWRPRIVDYEVTNTLNIATRQLDLAAKLIDSANRAGANTIDSISFGLANPRMYRAEAIKEATRHAIEDANVLAESAALKLVRIMSMTLDSAQPQPPAPMSRRMMMASGAAEASTPIVPGDVTIRATVNIVYEIAPRE